MRARYGRNKGGKGCIVVVGGHEVTALLTKKGKIGTERGGVEAMETSATLKREGNHVLGCAKHGV